MFKMLKSYSSGGGNITEEGILYFLLKNCLQIKSITANYLHEVVQKYRS